MNPKQITLARKVTINSISEAQALGVHQVYVLINDAITDIFNRRGFKTYEQLPQNMLNEINTSINNSYGTAFVYNLKDSVVIKDVTNLRNINIDKIKLYFQGLKQGLVQLSVLCTTLEHQLLDTVGTYALIALDTETDGKTNVFTLALNSDCIINSILI